MCCKTFGLARWETQHDFLNASAHLVLCMADGAGVHVAGAVTQSGVPIGLAVALCPLDESVQPAGR